MPSHREVGNDIHGGRGRPGPCVAEGNRQSRAKTVGRERNHEPQCPRDSRSPMPRQLPKNRSVSRFFARHSRADGGHPGFMGRECGNHSSTYSPRGYRRSRGRAKVVGRDREREGSKGGRGTETRTRKKRKIGGYRIPGNSFGWEDKRPETSQAPVSEEEEVQEEVKEKQEAKSQSLGEQSEWEPKHRSREQQQRRDDQFGRFRSPLPRRSPHQAAREADTRDLDEAFLGGDESSSGSAPRGRERRCDQTNPALLLEAACDVEECSSSSEARVVDIGVCDRSAPAAQHFGGTGPYDSAGKGHRAGPQRCYMVSSPEHRAGPPRSGNHRQCSGGPGSSSGVPPRESGAERGCGERFREMEVDDRRRKREEGGRKEGGWQGRLMGRKERPRTEQRSPSRSHQVPVEPEVKPDTGGSVGSCPDHATRPPGLGTPWDKFLSKDLGIFIHDVLLGRCDCGFSSLIRSFCEGKGEPMARGKRDQKTSVFPLPLPSRDSVKRAVEKRDGVSLWLFLLVCALNYLNGGVHARMETLDASPVQQVILGYLKGRVDVFQEHEFEIGTFDWGKFLQTRTVSYTYEEVCAAQWTSLDHVQPALPYGAIGSVKAIEYAEDGVLDLLLNPFRYLQPSWDHQNVASPQWASWNSERRAVRRSGSSPSDYEPHSAQQR